MRLARAVTLLALVAGAVLIGYVLLGSGDGGNHYKLLFETGGQLVKGNEVLVAGQPIGIIDDLSLTDDGQAQVEVTVDRPLHEGTTAVIRATSLSGIANRYISVHPGPNSEPEMESGSTLESIDTTTPVDLDQFFNAFKGPTRKALQDFIQGQATVYTGNTEGARESYKYFAPSLQSTQRLLSELTKDQRVFEQFLVSGSQVFGALAERRDDLSSLTSNANQALGAIAAENESLSRSLRALPPFMRQGNTTFLNLRAALDDLDPLVETSKTATRNLPEFLRDLRPVARRAVPVVDDLRLTVDRSGSNNDLAELLRATTRTNRAASSAVPRVIESLDDSQDIIEFARPYTPDLFMFLRNFGQAAGYYDANGHYLRVMPTATGAFEYDGYDGDDDDLDGELDDLIPIYDQPARQLDFFLNNPNNATPLPDAFSSEGFRRCPGGASQPAEDGSSPFDDDGALAGNCDDDDVALPPPGP